MLFVLAKSCAKPQNCPGPILLFAKPQGPAGKKRGWGFGLPCFLPVLCRPVFVLCSFFAGQKPAKAFFKAHLGLSLPPLFVPFGANWAYFLSFITKRGSFAGRNLSIPSVYGKIGAVYVWAGPKQPKKTQAAAPLFRGGRLYGIGLRTKTGAAAGIKP